MFILPIGHDKLIRRLPYLTIILIGLNTLIWLITYPIEMKQHSRINSLYRELHQKETNFLVDYIQEHPDASSDPKFDENFHKAIEEGEIVDRDSEEYRGWKEIYTRFKNSLNNRVFYRFGFKPTHISLLTLISSLFLHSSFSHLFFNMLFLWLVGVNIEDYWGRPLFLSLFIIGGIFASLFYTIFNQGSNIPLIGASGAISAVMGAFTVRFYKTKIRFFYFFLFFLRPFWGTFRLYAWFALGFWFAEQVFYTMLSSGTFTGVAFFAHVGGFLFGLAVGFGMKYIKVEEKYISNKIEKQIEGVALHPKLKEAFRKRDAGDIIGETELLKEVLKDEPANSDARLELARSLLLLDKKRESAREYEIILSGLYEKGKTEELFNAYLEVYEKEVAHFFSAKMQYRIATLLTSMEEYRKAVELLSLIVKNHPGDRLAPLSLLKTGKIFLQYIGDVPIGSGALEFLIKNYPDYSGINEAKNLLAKYNN